MNIPKAFTNETSIADKALKSQGTENIPKYFFKYISNNSNHFRKSMHELLTLNKIYLSSKSEFNDPFDSAVYIAEISKDQVDKYLDEVLNRFNLSREIKNKWIDLSQCPIKFRDALATSLNQQIDKQGIYSLSASIKNPLMWAHYANSHQGIAIVFNHNRNDEKFNPLPICYQTQYQENPNSFMDLDYLFIKGEEWRYEKEWRIIEKTRAKELFELPENVINGIVLGAKCDDSTSLFLKDLIKSRTLEGRPPISLYRAGINDKFFQLDFYEEIDGQYNVTDIFD
jgi:hypothetical protein